MRRFGVRGLIPTLGRSSIGLTLEDVGPEYAVLLTATSAVQRQPRFPREMEKAVPWWMHPQHGHWLHRYEVPKAYSASGEEPK